LRQYNEEIDKTIIEILHQNGERTYGKLKESVEKSLTHTISFETYSNRLNAMVEPSITQSRYAIQPILQKRDEGRGKNVSYSLTKHAKIRCDLQLPILKSESMTERAYRLLFYYMVFFYNQNRKLKDEHEYYVFLEKFSISKNELEYQGKNIVKDKDSKYNVFESTIWIHAQSEIRFIQKHYLEGSGNEGKYEYFYILPGISPLEFRKIREPRLVYQDLNFKEGEVIRYFELLEKLNLIKKLQLYPLTILNEERYVIVDDRLKEILAECWTLQSYILTYLEYVWKSLSKSTKEERIWYEHLWGKYRSNQWFIECNNCRRNYQKENKNQLLKETQERINYEKIQIIKKFESIKEKYSKKIKHYSYFIKPLLNVVYPDFLRKEFKQ
jgi:hypothetical protein